MTPTLQGLGEFSQRLSADGGGQPGTGHPAKSHKLWLLFISLRVNPGRNLSNDTRKNQVCWDQGCSPECLRGQVGKRSRFSGSGGVQETWGGCTCPPRTWQLPSSCSQLAGLGNTGPTWQDIIFHKELKNLGFSVIHQFLHVGNSFQMFSIMMWPTCVSPG